MSREITNILLAQKKLEKEINNMSKEMNDCYARYDENFKIGQVVQSQKWLARANALKDCIKTLKECLAYVS